MHHPALVSRVIDIVDPKKKSEFIDESLGEFVFCESGAQRGLFDEKSLSQKSRARGKNFAVHCLNSVGVGGSAGPSNRRKHVYNQHSLLP
jgi:hypothetical protein